MKIKFTFWEISFKGQVLNRTFTFKGAKKWMKKWMEENLNKHHKVVDPETGDLVDFGEVIYNGFDKVQIRECIVNDERKSPEMIVSYTYYHTED
jgi:hypothetical protein